MHADDVVIVLLLCVAANWNFCSLHTLKLRINFMEQFVDTSLHIMQ